MADPIAQGPGTTRREALLACGTAALTALTAPATAAEPVGKVKPLTGDALLQAPIDAHVHVWTPDLARYPLAASFRREQMQPASFTPDELFAHAVPAGVGRIVLIQMSYYGFDNSYMLDAIVRHLGVFAGVAVIDENAERPENTMRSLAKHRVTGFRLYPQTKNIDAYFGSPGMAAMWKCGAEDRLAMCCLINPEALPAVDAMCAKYPYTPVVIDHFGRIGIDGVVRQADVQNLLALARHKQVRVKISAYYALGKKKSPYDDLVPLIRQLVDAFGPKRLMWASDSPFQVQEPHTYRASLDLVRQRLDFVGDEDRQWLLTKTAAETFFR